MPKRRNLHRFVLSEIAKTDWLAAHRPIKRESLPSPIRSSHHWTFRITDRRRANLKGRDGVTISGVEVRSHGLPHMTSDPFRTGFCRLLDASEEDEDADDAEDDDEGSGEKAEFVLDEGMSEHLGWKTSYRKSDPDDVSKHRAKHLRRLQTKQTAFTPLLSRLPSAGRFMEWQPSVAAAHAAKERQREWKKGFRAERAAARVALVE